MTAGSGSPTKVNAEAMNAIKRDIKHAGDTGQCDRATQGFGEALVDATLQSRCVSLIRVTGLRETRNAI